ncbi:hypothetical protein [Polyangium sp. 15x6]|uniref:hypothetical protein n=1 Tax=Polyangium sp. 15x6 TaxID=3042687 RepID=UPI00249BDF0C|nr:hypothetical protein [Polyangium sp. 15x6]MDI3289432.1 hypothetical protein [Polyangium sp. 15x6]
MHAWKRPPHPATLQRREQPGASPPHPAMVQRKAMLPENLTAKPPHPATVQCKRAASIQRVPIGPSDLETTDPSNRGRVLAYLREIGPIQMRDILDRMLRENNRANDEYIQICRLELARDDALVALDGIVRRDGGVWTSVLVFVEKVFVFQTDPVRAGEHDETDTYGIAAGVEDAEMAASVRDSEVATLNMVLRDQRLRWDQLRPGYRIDFIVVSNMGPCDGCKTRLQNFLDQLRRHPYCWQLNFSLESDYMTPPNDVDRQRLRTTYGYHGDNSRTSPSRVRYYFHRLG